MTNQELKKGSIVRLSYNTYANQVKEDWQIIRTYLIDNTEFVEYVADCVVCHVTPKFFRVIIPHLNSVSVRYSKRCFTDTKSSYANINGFRAEIVKY